MTPIRQVLTFAQRLGEASAESATVFLRDTGHGLLELSHNTFALLGLVGVAGVLFVGGHVDTQQALETQAREWLQARLDARADPSQPSEPEAVDRATAADLAELTPQQATVAIWISRRYHVAPEPISRLVKEAWSFGNQSGLEPTLILAIMAVESSFNPFAQSNVGAQGLMQVMTRVHDDKYEPFGGNFAAFDPVTNLRVGTQVLKECITRAGSVEAGLRAYVGASNLADDGGYTSKVLAEQSQLRLVAGGKLVPVNAPRQLQPSAEQLALVRSVVAAR